MSHAFRKPDFHDSQIELRYEDGTICIYGTAEGLKTIASFCQELIDNPEIGHIHFESYPVLTKESEKGVIAIFTRTGD